MKDITKFDTLIVYSAALAKSAQSAAADTTTPFVKGSSVDCYNLVYGYFLKTCSDNNLNAAFTTSADIVGPGLVRSYWLFKNQRWTKVLKKAYSKNIFDKFSPTSGKRKVSRKLLFSSNRVRPFNDPQLFNMCFDKQLTYDKLYEYSIPTVSISGATKKEINKSYKALREKIKNHKNGSDFSNEIVLKDRFGAGGLNVYKFKNVELNLMTQVVKKHKWVSFIIQPFVKFDQGFKYKNMAAAPTDIRYIYLGNKLIQTYIRIAKKGDFKCNEHAGGLLKYISKNELPNKLTSISNKVAKVLNRKSSLYSLDYIISNNGNSYLLETNSGPGLDWNTSIKENEIEAKKLIRIIVKEIARRVNSSKYVSGRKVKTILPTSFINEPTSLHEPIAII